MNAETLAIENREILPREQAEDLALQQTAEITSLPLESFKLVGGGSSVVVL